MARSETRKNFWGNEYVVHLDDDGNETGRSYTEEKLFGGEVTKNLDSDGNLQSTSEREKTLFGEDRTVTRSKAGDVESITTKETPLFGEEHLVTKDRDGNVKSRTYNREGFFGNKYRETVSDGSSSDTDQLVTGLFKLGLWIGLIVFVLWLIFMAIAITLMLSPIWLGAVTAGVIAGYFLAPRVLARIPADALGDAPVYEEQKKKKKPRQRLADGFFKSAVRFNPDVLCVIGATLLFGLALALWPLISTKDEFTQVLLGVGVIAGAILGTMAGRRVLCWQLENLLFAKVGIENPTQLVAPTVALGFSIPGLLILAGVWILSLTQSSGPVDFAKSFGLKNEQTSRSTVASNGSSNPIPTVTTFPQLNQAQLPKSLGQSVASPKIPDGYLIPEQSLSPNGQYGVLVPDYAHFQQDVNGQNKLMEVKTATAIAPIDGESWFQDPKIGMNHGAAAARWSADGAILAWVVGGKWSPRTFNMLKVSDGAVSWQVDVLAKVQKEMLRQTRSAAPDAYELARKENRGSGSAFPDGFVIDVQVPEAGFALPLTVTTTLDSNPKQIEGKTSLRSSLRATIDETGVMDFSGFELLSGGSSVPSTSSADGIQEFIRQRLQIEQTHNLDRIVSQYADQVTYWDNGSVDQAFIRKDKADYFSRWPITSEEITTPIEVSRDGSEWTARFKTNFKVENQAKGVVIQGVQESIYSMRFMAGQFKIVSENGKVLQKEKRETAPQSSFQSGSPASDRMPGERFPETRTKQLAVNDVNGMSLDGVRYAINEMFARHGADFPKAEIKRHFQQFSWYRPRPGRDFDQIEAEFTEVEKVNVKLLGEARDLAGSRGEKVAPSSSGDASLRPSSKSRFVTTRELKKLVGQQVRDTWFYGDFVAASISGNTVIMYPIWGGGFVRGYSTEIRATFKNGVPPFPGRERLPMDPIDSTAGIQVNQSQPLRIMSVTKSVKPGTSSEVVVIRAEQ